MFAWIKIKTLKMASTHAVSVLETIESKLGEILKNPGIFYKHHLENSDNIKQLSQKTYIAAVRDELFKGKTLSKLLTDGFDEEQIWQQSDLLNKASSPNILDFIRNFDVKDILSVLSASSLSESLSNDKNFESAFNNEEHESLDENASSFSSQESNVEEDYAFDDDSDSHVELDSNSIPKKENHFTQRKQEHSSSVDDQFFKLSKLEKFLQIEDLKEERGEDPASDDEIDLFQDVPSDDCDVSDDESENEQAEVKKSARNFMYEDFFDDPDSEGEDENNNEGEDQDFMKENEEYSLDESGSDAEIGTKVKENQPSKVAENSVNNTEDKKSKFDLEQEKIKKKIQEYEKSMLQPLPWHLTGEVAAEKRPIDSLLEQEADFDCNAKQDFVVDEALTKKIEEITIMAIRNKAYSDVERKYKSTEEVIKYKKEIALEQTKSKKSLAEVYEEDYLKKQYKQDASEEEDPKHKEIKKVMDSLLPQLYALFSNIPKPAIPEIKIVSNLPAVTVEEVAPTNVSDAALLAPEEVKKRTGVIKSKTERTDTDRKRERRKKKIHQKLKEKKKLQKLESQAENPSAKLSKLEKIQTLKKIKQHKNTQIATVDESGKIKSSKDFFSRLQDTLDTKNKKTKLLNKKVKNK